MSNALVGFQGRVGDMVDLDFGAAYTKSKYIEQGRGYIVASIAEEKINSGEYDIYKPNANPSQVLQSFTALVGRDGVWDQKEVYGTAAMEFMKLDGGGAQVLVGAEWREENYQDLYDSLSEAGQILGSAGNSAGGTRDVTSLYAEMFLPFTKTFEVQLAGRYEKYSDYGSDFSPKASFRWRAMPTLAVRGSIGTGFRAPSLPVLTAKTSFSAESVFDPVSCAVLNGDPADECQVNTYIQSNSSLSSEQSDQFSFGLVFDPTNWLSLKADYWNIKISDTITYISAQSIVDRDNGTDPRAIPPGLGLTRDATTGVISRIDAGYANEGTLKTDGIDLNAVTKFGFGEWGSLTQNWTYSRIFSYDVDGTDIIGDVGSPKDRAVLGNTWAMGPFSATWNINYIGSQESSPTLKVGSYVTHDLQFSWMPPIKGMTLTAVCSTPATRCLRWFRTTAATSTSTCTTRTASSRIFASRRSSERGSNTAPRCRADRKGRPRASLFPSSEASPAVVSRRRQGRARSSPSDAAARPRCRSAAHRWRGGEASATACRPRHRARARAARPGAAWRPAAIAARLARPAGRPPNLAVRPARNRLAVAWRASARMSAPSPWSPRSAHPPASAVH